MVARKAEQRGEKTAETMAVGKVGRWVARRDATTAEELAVLKAEMLVA